MRTIARCGKGALPFLLLLAALGCERRPPPPTRTAAKGSIYAMASTPADRTASPGRSVVLGTGWYANVEVDSKDRVHLAWTDADRAPFADDPSLNFACFVYDGVPDWNAAEASVPSSSTTSTRISLLASSSPPPMPPIIVPKKIAARMGNTNVKKSPA